jgi:transposase
MDYRSINEKRRAVNPNLLFVGIDVAKRKHCARARFPDQTLSAAFFFSNNAQGLTRFLAQTRKWRESAKLDDLIVGMEPTGHYFKPLARKLKQHGAKVVMVSPRDVKREKTGFNNSPTKGDAKDSALIADLVARGCYCHPRLDTGPLAVLQRLVNHRRQLVKDLTVVANRLQADLDERFPEFATVYDNFESVLVRSLLEHYPSPASLLGASVAEIIAVLKGRGIRTVDPAKVAALRSKAAETIGSEEGWGDDCQMVIQDKLSALNLLKAQLVVVDRAVERIARQFEETRYMTSLKGIGPLSAGIILAETSGLERYRTGDAAIKMAGLDLVECSTGETHGRRHISHYGRSHLRMILYLDAIVQTRQGMPLHDLYVRLVAKGKSKVEALVAVACEILRILCALVRDKRYYTPEPPPRVKLPVVGSQTA